MYFAINPLWAPRALAVLRIVAALLFLAHGTGKLAGLPTSSDDAAVRLAGLVWWLL